MNKAKAMIALRRVNRTVSVALMFKSMVGLAVVSLTLVGITVPHFGFEPTLATDASAAGFGAVVGAVLALKA